MERLFINAKDVAKLSGQSKRTAYRTIRVIKDVQKCKKVTLSMYCTFYDLNIAEVRELLTKS